MYEHYSQRPLPRRHFIRRLIIHSAVSLALIIGSLILGIIGYQYYEELPWSDAFVNQEPSHPKEEGLIEYAALMALTPLLSAVAIYLNRRPSEPAITK
jgi:hypothetical protein